jgi:hypothetical protein
MTIGFGIIAVVVVPPGRRAKSIRRHSTNGRPEINIFTMLISKVVGTGKGLVGWFHDDGGGGGVVVERCGNKLLCGDMADMGGKNQDRAAKINL